MDSSTADIAGMLVRLAIAGLFTGALFYLGRLNQRLVTLRGAQSELHGLLRACSDSIDAAETSIGNLREASVKLAGDIGRSLERAETLKADVDATCAAATRLLSRLAEEPAVLELKAAARAAMPHPAPENSAHRPPARRIIARIAPAELSETPPAPTEPQPIEPRWTDRLRPSEEQSAGVPDPSVTGDRPAMRLFRDTIRAL